MSEICEICGRSRATCFGDVSLTAAEATRACYRLGYERTLAQADRYQAEFAACKALLIAEQKRAERAEADRAEAEAAHLRFIAEHNFEAFDQLRKEASEARVLALREAAEAVRGMHKKLHPQGGFNTTVAECVDAIGALSAEPYYRGVDVVDCYVNGGEERPALAALPVEPARPEQKEIQRDGDTPSAPVRCDHRDCGGGPHKSHLSSHPSPTGDT